MVCAGDEFGRTQIGNNNAYCQDDEISWVHWDMDEDRLSLVNFFRRLTSAFHLYPVLRRFASDGRNESRPRSEGRVLDRRERL